MLGAVVGLGAGVSVFSGDDSVAVDSTARDVGAAVDSFVSVAAGEQATASIIIESTKLLVILCGLIDPLCNAILQIAECPFLKHNPHCRLWNKQQLPNT